MNIFKFISRILLFAAVLSVTTTLVSCEEIGGETWERSDDLSSYIPDYCITFTGSWSISGSIASFNLEPRIFADFDYWQLKIKSIDYYIDETLIKTDTKEPYSFIYTALELSEGQHRLVAKVKIEDLVNHREIVIFPVKDFEVKPSSQPDSSNGLMYSAGWSKSGNNVYFNIENVGIWSSLVDSGWRLASVSFYIDSELIDTVYEEPFGFAYTAKDLSKGKHIFIIKGKVANVSNAQELELVRKIEIDMP